MINRYTEDILRTAALAAVVVAVEHSKRPKPAPLQDQVPSWTRHQTLPEGTGKDLTKLLD
jgi:hypothetical protein